MTGTIVALGLAAAAYALMWAADRRDRKNGN